MQSSNRLRGSFPAFPRIRGRKGPGAGSGVDDPVMFGTGERGSFGRQWVEGSPRRMVKTGASSPSGLRRVPSSVRIAGNCPCRQRPSEIDLRTGARRADWPALGHRRFWPPPIRAKRARGRGSLDRGGDGGHCPSGYNQAPRFGKKRSRSERESSSIAMVGRGENRCLGLLAARRRPAALAKRKSATPGPTLRAHRRRASAWALHGRRRRRPALVGDRGPRS